MRLFAPAAGALLLSVSAGVGDAHGTLNLPESRNGAQVTLLLHWASLAVALRPCRVTYGIRQFGLCHPLGVCRRPVVLLRCRPPFTGLKDTHTW